MADQNDKQEQQDRDDNKRGQADWGDSGRSEDWTDNQRYGEREGWDVDSSYGTDWEDEPEEPLWESQEDDAANRPNPESLTSGQSGDDDSTAQAGAVDETRRDMMQPDMEVYDRDGEPVGVVAEVRQTDMLVRRTGARDIYIPRQACRQEGDKLRLNIPVSEIHDQGWEMPPVIATPMTGGTAGMPDELKEAGKRAGS